MESRNCFGTTEFNEKNGICGGCSDYFDCQKILPKKNIKKIRSPFLKQLLIDKNEMGKI